MATVNNSGQSVTKVARPISTIEAATPRGAVTFCATKVGGVVVTPHPKFVPFVVRMECILSKQCEMSQVEKGLKRTTPCKKKG